MAKAGWRPAACEATALIGGLTGIYYGSLDLTQSGQIQTVISKEEYYGMQTFERALFKLIEEGQTDYAEALQIPAACTASA